MKVVLAVDVKSLGRKGQLVSTADGYAQNWLLPRRLALLPPDPTAKKLKLAPVQSQPKPTKSPSVSKSVQRRQKTQRKDQKSISKLKNRNKLIENRK